MPNTDRKPGRADRPDMPTLRRMAGGTDADAYELAVGTGFLPAMAAELIALRREARELRGTLRRLAWVADVHLDKVDRIMAGPATPERGQAIAATCNELNLEVDSARRFGLGVDGKWKPIRKGG